MQHVRNCYPRTTAYTAIMVTILVIFALLEILGMVH